MKCHTDETKQHVEKPDASTVEGFMFANAVGRFGAMRTISIGPSAEPAIQEEGHD